MSPENLKHNNQILDLIFLSFNKYINIKTGQLGVCQLGLGLTVLIRSPQNSVSIAGSQSPGGFSVTAAQTATHRVQNPNSWVENLEKQC